jgi:hypothetical protein
MRHSKTQSSGGPSSSQMQPNSSQTATVGIGGGPGGSKKGGQRGKQQDLLPQHQSLGSNVTAAVSGDAPGAGSSSTDAMNIS